MGSYQIDRHHDMYGDKFNKKVCIGCTSYGSLSPFVDFAECGNIEETLRLVHEFETSSNNPLNSKCDRDINVLHFITGGCENKPQTPYFADTPDQKMYKDAKELGVPNRMELQFRKTIQLPRNKLPKSSIFNNNDEPFVLVTEQQTYYNIITSKLYVPNRREYGYGPNISSFWDIYPIITDPEERWDLQGYKFRFERYGNKINFNVKTIIMPPKTINDDNMAAPMMTETENETKIMASYETYVSTPFAYKRLQCRAISSIDMELPKAVLTNHNCVAKDRCRDNREVISWRLRLYQEDVRQTSLLPHPHKNNPHQCYFDIDVEFEYDALRYKKKSPLPRNEKRCAIKFRNINYPMSSVRFVNICTTLYIYYKYQWENDNFSSISPVLSKRQYCNFVMANDCKSTISDQDFLDENQMDMLRKMRHVSIYDNPEILIVPSSLEVEEIEQQRQLRNKQLHINDDDDDGTVQHHLKYSQIYAQLALDAYNECNQDISEAIN